MSIGQRGIAGLRVGLRSPSRHVHVLVRVDGTPTPQGNNLWAPHTVFAAISCLFAMKPCTLESSKHSNEHVGFNSRNLRSKLSGRCASLLCVINGIWNATKVRSSSKNAILKCIEMYLRLLAEREWETPF